MQSLHALKRGLEMHALWNPQGNILKSGILKILCFLVHPVCWSILPVLPLQWGQVRALALCRGHMWQHSHAQRDLASWALGMFLTFLIWEAPVTPGQGQGDTLLLWQSSPPFVRALEKRKKSWESAGRLGQRGEGGLCCRVNIPGWRTGCGSSGERSSREEQW